jgi:hypothetical protein
MSTFLGRSLALLTVAVMLTACSTTTLNNSWKDPAFTGKVRKIYVVGVARQEINRRVFEDTFERELTAQGATGIASYHDLSTEEADNQDNVVARLNKHGADSILMARMTNMRIEQVTSPGYVSSNSTFGGYYNNRYNAVYVPPTTTEFQIATIEANLYETKGGKLVWSAQLEILVDNNVPKLFDDFVKVVSKDLKEKGLL